MASPGVVYDVAALYDEHKDAMHAAAAKVLNGDRHRAEDAVMAAIEGLLKKPPAERIANTEAYMVKCAVYRAKDELKRAGNKAASLEAMEYDPPDPSSDLETDVVEWLDQRRQVQEVLAGLDPRQRYVAEHLIANMEPRGDVATHLGVSESRVSQLKGEVLAKMREIAHGKEVI